MLYIFIAIAILISSIANAAEVIPLPRERPIPYYKEYNNTLTSSQVTKNLKQDSIKKVQYNLILLSRELKTILTFTDPVTCDVAKNKLLQYGHSVDCIKVM